MHQERVRSRSKVHQLLRSDGEEVQQLVGDSGRGEEGQPVGDQQTQTLVWKTGVQADGSPWVDSVPEHLTNVSLGLLPRAFNRTFPFLSSPSRALYWLSGPPSTYCFPGVSDSKGPACKAGDQGSVPELGRFSRRKAWQPTPVFLSGESHGQRSLAGYGPWGHKESDTIEVTNMNTHIVPYPGLQG